MPCLAGEFQEVVDVKLRHTHPRVQKQRAAAANLAAAVAASAASATSSLEETDSRDHAAAEEGTVPQPSSSSKPAADEGKGMLSAAAAAASAAVASSSGGGIQVIQVLPWADAASSTGPGSRGEVLLELDGVSINTPDGGLALVQNLSLKVRGPASAGTSGTGG